MSKDNSPHDPVNEMFNAMWDPRPFVTIGTCASPGRLSIHVGDTSLNNAEKVLALCEEHGLSVEMQESFGSVRPKMSVPVEAFEPLVAALREINARIEIGGSALVMARYAKKGGAA